MIKLYIRFFVICFAAFPVAGFVYVPNTFAQESPSEFELNRILRAFETLELDVPDVVTAKVSAILDETEHLYAITMGINPAYFGSEQHKQDNVKLKELQSLLLPYVEEVRGSHHPDVPAVYVDRPGLNAAQQTQHLVGLYETEYQNYGTPISYDDLLNLERVIGDHRDTYEKLMALNAEDFSVVEYAYETRKLRSRLRELMEMRRNILKSYKAVYQNRMGERSRALAVLARSRVIVRHPAKVILTVDDRIDNEYRRQREYEGFDRFGISISVKDELKIKSLMKQRSELILEDHRLCSNGLDHKQCQAKTEEYRHKLNEISRNIREIKQPYSDALKDIKLRTGYD